MRFNTSATTIDEAKEYIHNRAKQLLRHYFKLDRIFTYDWGISAYFNKHGEVFQALYVLKQYQGQGIYKQKVTHTIVTAEQCGIEDFLTNKEIDFISFDLNPYPEYDIISTFYGDKKAKRSGVPLINHIDEGLYILAEIGASSVARKAYCFHPVVQSDEDLFASYGKPYMVGAQTMAAAIEYRSVANEYLSKRIIQSIDEIRLSPLDDVNDMLIADKIQNRKDFDLYHKATHPRSAELDEYFENWFKRLGITSKFYNECVNFCS